MEEMDNRDRIAKRERKKHKKSDDFKIKDWVKIIGSAFVIAFLITQFVFSATVVDGNSMQDTLQHHDRLFIRKLGVSVDTLKRGDIIVFHAPDEKTILKELWHFLMNMFRLKTEWYTLTEKDLKSHT